MEQPDRVEMCPGDAARRGIRDGDWVRVYNDRGEVRLRAHVNGAVQAGVVATRLTWAKSSPSGLSINALTSETLTDMGDGPTFYSCLVEIEREAGERLP
jgi:anaerobic selenocysteine-containing dehydrogenase